MKNKIFTLLFAMVASVGSLLAESAHQWRNVTNTYSNTPTAEDLEAAGYHVEDSVVLCMYFDDAPCYDVYMVGNYRTNSSGGWSTDIKELKRFEALPDFNGWYAVEIPYTDTIQGKPVQLTSDGLFSWEYQSGDANAWIYQGGQLASVYSGYSGEANVYYDNPGCYIYELAYWKNHNNPCIIVPKHNYTIQLYAPDACGDMIPAVTGSFNNWSDFLAMSESTDLQGRKIYTYTIYSEEGQFFKFADSELGWANELLYKDQYTSLWKAFDNYVLPIASKDTTLVFDYSDNTKYRFNMCAETIEPVSYNFVEIDGLYYNFNIANNTAEVTYPKFNEAENYTAYKFSTVNIPSTVTYNGNIYNVTAIGNYAFYECYSLTSITIPNNITEIGSEAFAYCTSLDTIYDDALVPQDINSDAFTNINTSLCYLVVPKESINLYKSANIWEKFAFVNETLDSSITVRLNPSSTLDWDNVYLFSWTEIGDNKIAHTEDWPGKQVNKDADGWWTYTFDSSLQDINIIWNNGINAQTTDITNITESTCYTLNNATDINFDSNLVSVSTINCPNDESANIEIITIRLDSMSYNVRDWEDAYAFVWTGNTDAYYAYYQYSDATRVLWGERAVLDENGYYSVSFEAEPGLQYHVGWRSSSGSYPSSNWSITNVTGSVCCEYVNRLVVTDCFEGSTPIDTITVRLNPFSVEWDHAYLYAWRGTNSYSYADRSRSTRKLAWATEATIDEDGWYAVSFPIDASGVYSFSWSNSNSSSSFSSSDTIMGASGSICTTRANSKLTRTACDPLAPTTSTSFIIHEVTAGTLGQLLVSQMNQWTDVLSLKVIGTMNAADMELFSYMTELQRLDLSETDITSITGCRDLVYLQEVILPPTCTVVNERAFQNCKRLKTINLDHVLNIGNYAFCMDESPTSYYYFTGFCSLTSVHMPSVLSIGKYAFSGARKLSECDMTSATSIGECAFANCPQLLEINIPNVVSLGTYAFYMYYSSNSQQRQIILSDNLEIIPSYCFYSSSQQQTMNIPASLKKLGNYALYMAQDTIILPEGLVTVESSNFSNAHVLSIPSSIQTFNAFSSTWETIYCYAVDPAFTNPFANNNVSNMTLYVPSASLAAYKLSDDFHGFKQILPLDLEVSTLNIRGNMMLLSMIGISDNADVTVHRDAELTISSSTPFVIGDYTQYISTFNNKYYTNSSSSGPWYSGTPCTGMLLANSAMTADSIVVHLVPRANRWNFFSLPYDVNMQDITVETEGIAVQGTLQWVIREYSGANRASGSGSTWVNVPANGTLQAHKGYILYWTVSGGSSYNNNSSSNYGMPSYNALYYFCMPAANNANKQNMFASDNVNITLTEYPAEVFQNSSWNLIGNPYPCALTIQAIDFNAPITIWNGNTYVAYSLQDDDFVLRPAEAFFVQAPQGETGMTFYKSGRSVGHTRDITKEEYNNYYNAPQRRTNVQAERKIFNFYLSNEDYFDRARLVLNEQASADYEITCDAAKMFSSDNAVPQLYLNNNDVLYAIDERPVQNGQFILGALFGEAGQYTLSIEMPENDAEGIVVLDTETGVSTDLTMGGYTFSTESGTFDSRFVVSFVSRMPTDINNNIHTNIPVKALRNGHLIIYAPNGKTYTVEGQEL